MLKKIGRILLGILLVSLMVACSIFIIQNKKAEAKEAGSIYVVINTKDNDIICKERVSYNEGDTLYEVINRNFNIESSQTAYGHFLLSIDWIKTDGKTSWLWFELAYLKEDTMHDGIELSEYEFQNVTTGIDGIALVDGMIFAINERDATHPASIQNQDINFVKEYHSKDTYKILLYVVLGILFVLFIAYFITSKNEKKITVKELAILSFMTVLVFVQEELLSVLPNIQFTFLLFAVYTSVFGYRKTSLIVAAHVLLDNLIMGSLNPIVVIPMLVGYLLYIFMISIVKNKPLWLITLVASIGSLVYCYLFLLANAVFLDIDVFAYFIADIPFEILLVASTIFTIVYLYNPLVKKLNELMYKEPIQDSIDYHNIHK